MLARLKKKGKLKLKKEDILKYGTEEEIETLKEVRSLFKQRPGSPESEWYGRITRNKLSQIMHLLSDLDEVSLEKIKKEVEFLLVAKEYEE